MIKVNSITSPCILVALSVTFVSCGFRKKSEAVQELPQPIIEKTEAVAEIKKVKKPAQGPISKTVVMTVNPAETKGTINLSMDPKGAVLGMRRAEDTRPLKGTVTIKITEYPETGKKQIAIQDIQLRNTEVYHLNFSWGALVGSMRTSIAKNVLRIIPNDLNRVATLKESGQFTLPQCYFTVQGHSQVKGAGLVLAKVVGDKKVNLTMKKTEPVDLKASLTEKGNVLTLQIIRAVMRDRLDLDEAQLGLLFTADITATAQNL